MNFYATIIKGQNPVGTYSFSVNVQNKGLAQITSSVTTLTFSLTASSISPSLSGTGGNSLEYLLDYLIHLKY
jgi:hypothetical protein